LREKRTQKRRELKKKEQVDVVDDDGWRMDAISGEERNNIVQRLKMIKCTIK
jgi:hypothetical protein